ncbi:MAG: hypothetical protein HQ518_30735 [Rhodopirellula sp.]|nr:hypothetical protein [Rhodopirellula sp.]
MTIHCECDHCGASLKVKDKLAGTEGKCPKCRAKILIPNASSDDSDDVLLGDDPNSSPPEGPKKSAQEEEEDAIFGDDFFSMQEPAPRPRFVATVSADDDEDEPPPPPKKKAPVSAEPGIAGEAEPGSGGNAASIASSLLSKTGKRNRPGDFKDPANPEKVSYDFSEINYLLLQRVLPCVVVGVVLFSFFYWIVSGSFGGGAGLPELATLTGRVTSNGEGVAAHLSFSPVPGTGRDAGYSGGSSFAFSDADGAYEAFYDDDVEGLVLGKHEVQITVGTVRVNREITIEAGSQVIDFELNE